MNIREIKIGHISGLSFWALLYVYAGIYLWLIEWIRPWIAIPVIGLLSIALLTFGKEPPPQEKRISWKTMLLLAVVLLFFVVLCGNGGFFRQAGDWGKHNLILNDLIKENGPVYYHNDDSDAMLTYYIGQYLIPAAVGKVFHSFRVGEIAMLFWNFLGVYLTVLLLIRITKADTCGKQIFAAVAFMFFGTLIFLSRAVYGATAIGVADLSPSYSEWVSQSERVQFRSIFCILSWIPTNGPPAWIVTALFAEKMNQPKYWLVLATPLVLSATFPLVGLALLMLGVFFVNVSSLSCTITERKKLWKDCVSIPNLCALPVCIVEIIYLLGNISGPKPEEIGFSFTTYGANPTFYICFCLSFVCYSALLFQTFKYEPLFYIVNISLLLFPLFRMGEWNDLCMSASIPAVFLLLSFVIRGVYNNMEKANRQLGRVVVLSLLLFMGGLYPLNGMIDQLKTGPVWDGSAHFVYEEEIGTMGTYARRDGTVAVDMAYNYYTYDYKESPFYRWFAKDKRELSLKRNAER